MSCFSCCKRIDGAEKEFNYAPKHQHITNKTTAPQFELFRKEVMDKIEQYNKDLNNPEYVDDEGKTFKLDYDTLIDPANPFFMFKKIVKNHYINNNIVITPALECELKNICSRVKDLQKSGIPEPEPEPVKTLGESQ